MSAKKPEQEPAENKAAAEQPVEQPETIPEEPADGYGTEADEAVEAEQRPEPEPEPDPLAELERERDDYKDRWLRGVAELENFRKRSRREIDDSRRFAVADCLRDLLEILDNFERAEAALPDDGGDGEAFAAFRQGMALVHGRLNEILAGRGLERIEAEPGTEFDPNFHEAVMQVESEEFATGEITDVAQTGYRIGELVLRPTRVVVAR